jgi:hypothetical protein
MECRGFDNVVLLEYALGRLDEAENARVRLHIAHCEDCRSAVAELNPLAAMMTAGARTLRHDLSPPRAEQVMTEGRRVLAGVAVAPAAPAASPMPVSPLSVPVPAVRNLPTPASRAPAPSGAFARLMKPLAFAAAAAIAIAVFLKLRTPRDPWADLDDKLARGANLSELEKPLTRAAGLELAGETIDFSNVVDLEFAAWICRNVNDGPQVEYVKGLVSRVRLRRAAAPASSARGTFADFDWGATPAHAAAADDLAAVREALGGGRFDDVRARLSSAKPGAAGFVGAWAARAATSPDWAAAAREMGAAAALPQRELAGAAGVLAAIYQWQDGNRPGAFAQLARAGATDPQAWVWAAYMYRWGLNNEMKARAALLHVGDEELLTAELKKPAFAGLPPMYIQDEFDFESIDADDNWWRSPKTYLVPAGGTGTSLEVPSFDLTDENGERILRHASVTEKPATLLSRYPSPQSARDYVLQFDFRFDETDAASGADPYLNVFMAYNQTTYCYRIIVRPGAIQFSKRRPPLPAAELPAAPAAALPEHNGDHLEFLLPEGSPPRLPRALTVGAWYSLKIRVESIEPPAADGRTKPATRLSAKVWPRFESEPAEWNLVQLDDGVGGSPPYSGGDFGLLVHRAKMSFDNALLATRVGAGPR